MFRKVTFAAVVAVLALGAAACGSGSSPAGSSGDDKSGSPASSVPAGTDANSSFCKLAREYQDSSDEISETFRNIDFSDPEKAKQQMADAYRSLAPQFKKAFADALAVAPKEILNDLKLLGEGLTKFLDAMEKAGYDFEKVAQDPSVTAAFQDPTFLAAADKVGRYGQSACGIPYTPAATPSS